MKEIQLFGRMREPDLAKLEGELLDDGAYDQIVGGEDMLVFDSAGQPLAIYLHQAIPKDLIVQVHDDFRAMSRSGAQTNRGSAVSKDSRVYRTDEKGDAVTTGEVHPELFEHMEGATNGLVGAFDPNARYPYCRQTVYTMEHWAQFRWVTRYLRQAHALFAQHYPDRHAPQHAITDETNPSWVIPETCFTTITVNRNWQTAVHKDAGDFKPGCGVMGVIGNDRYRGGLFVYPKYRIAFDIRSGDLIVNNVHEWHANTPLQGEPGFERISIVMYYREHMFECATPAEEEAKRQAFYKEDPETRIYANRPILTDPRLFDPSSMRAPAPERRVYDDAEATQGGLGIWKGDPA